MFFPTQLCHTESGDLDILKYFVIDLQSLNKSKNELVTNSQKDLKCKIEEKVSLVFIKAQF